MTARMTTSLYCDRDTRPAVDGMRTVCGLQFGPADLPTEQLRHLAREHGWSATALSDYCPEHSAARRSTYA